MQVVNLFPLSTAREIFGERLTLRPLFSPDIIFCWTAVNKKVSFIYIRYSTNLAFENDYLQSQFVGINIRQKGRDASWYCDDKCKHKFTECDCLSLTTRLIVKQIVQYKNVLTVLFQSKRLINVLNLKISVLLVIYYHFYPDVNALLNSCVRSYSGRDIPGSEIQCFESYKTANKRFRFNELKNSCKQ